MHNVLERCWAAKRLRHGTKQTERIETSEGFDAMRELGRGITKGRNKRTNKVTRPGRQAGSTDKYRAKECRTMNIRGQNTMKKMIMVTMAQPPNR